MRGQRYCTCAFRPRQLSPFYPVTSRTLFRSPGPQPRGSKVARNNRSSRGPRNEAIIDMCPQSIHSVWRLEKNLRTHEVSYTTKVSQFQNERTTAGV